MKKFAVQHWDGSQWVTDLELDTLDIAIREADHLTFRHHGPDQWSRGGRVYNQIDGYVAH